jgi:hypothetical protein
MTDMSHLFSEIRRVERPATRIHNGKPTPFELSCSIEPPSTSNTETLQEHDTHPAALSGILCIPEAKEDTQYGDNNVSLRSHS